MNGLVQPQTQVEPLTWALKNPNFNFIILPNGFLELYMFFYVSAQYSSITKYNQN